MILQVALYAILSIQCIIGIALVTPVQYEDISRAVRQTTQHAITHSQLQSMLDHDSLHMLETQQNSLICSPYDIAVHLKTAMSTHFKNDHFHPVHFSKKENRVCFALSHYGNLDAAKASIEAISEDVVINKIPHALKVDNSVIAVANSLKAGERYCVEVVFGIGTGVRGVHKDRPAELLSKSLVAAAVAVSIDEDKRKELLKTFFWSSQENSAMQNHAWSKSFSAIPSHPLSCHFEQMHEDIGHASVTLTSPRDIDPACLLTFAAVSAMHLDVSLVQAHKGHALFGAGAKVLAASGTQPFLNATPATDQNAFIQSGNSVDKPYSDIGMNGSSYVIGYIDSGLDDLSCFLIDNSGTSTPRTPRDDYANPITEPERRKVIQYISWADGSPSTGYDHGTWCTGAATGSCIDTFSSANAYNGLAAGAKVTMFDVDVAEADNFVNVPSLYDICLPPVYNVGVRVHSNSWGTPGMTSQTSKSLDIDRFTYENPDFLFIVAASNDGADGYKSVSSPAVSKNALTVGATAVDHDQLAYFSSIGPVYDGSIKPDVVAPGQSLMSAGVRNSSQNQTASCNVQLSSGTSMATPIVAGAAVLIREYFENPKHWGSTCTVSYSSCPVVNPGKPGNFISGALLKAALAHSGEAISFYQSVSTIPAGNLSEPPPDVFQGWGQVLLKNVLPVPGVYDFNLYVADYESLQSFQTRYYFVTVNGSFSPLRVTISWIDPVNVVWAAKNLLNDLDLVIISPDGFYYYGNNIRGDEHNPTERIVMRPSEGLEPGVYTIMVVAKLLATESQTFGIVITTIGSVDESRTYTVTTVQSNVRYENETEQCEGTSDAPTGNVLVRFQLEDWQAGESWIGLDFQVKSITGVVLNSCSFEQNSAALASPFTRTSQCAFCLTDESTYTAFLDSSRAASGGATLIRVASSQCDNVHLSSYQQTMNFTLSGGSCNSCPPGSARMLVLMNANVTDDDYSDYSWQGLAFWSIYAVSNMNTPIHAGTLSISDEQADRYCIASGQYSVFLNDSALFVATGGHAEVTFSSTAGSSEVVLSGLSGVYSGTIQLGNGTEMLSVPPTELPSLAPSLAPTNTNCPVDWNQFEFNCYRFFYSPGTRSSAAGACASYGGWLVSIGSDAENQYAHSLALNLQQQVHEIFYIGLSDIVVDGLYVWDDGTPFDYSAWLPGEPNNEVQEDCVKMNFDSGWFNLDCSTGGNYMCEIPSTAPTAAPTTASPTLRPTTATPSNAPTTATPTVRPTNTNDTNEPTAAPSTRTPTAAPTNINCLEFWQQFEFSCYRFFNSSDNRDAAAAACATFGGWLVSISSEEENQFVTLVAGGNNAFIGLSDSQTEEVFIWDDGTPYAYENWLSGQPNGGIHENYVVINSGGWWEDMLNSDTNRYVCELPSSAPTRAPTPATDAPTVQPTLTRSPSTAAPTIANATTSNEENAEDFLTIEIKQNQLLQVVTAVVISTAFCAWVHYNRMRLSFKVAGPRNDLQLQKLGFVESYFPVILAIVSGLSTLYIGMNLYNYGESVLAVALLVSYMLHLVFMIAVLFSVFSMDSLSELLLGSLISQKPILWALVCLFSLISSNGVALLPWEKTDESTSLAGMPTVTMFLMCQGATAVRSAIVLTVLATSSLKTEMYFISIISSAFLLLLGLIAAIIRWRGLFLQPLKEDDCDLSRIMSVDIENNIKLGNLASDANAAGKDDETKMDNETVEELRRRLEEERLITSQLQQLVSQFGADKAKPALDESDGEFSTKVAFAEENIDIKNRQLMDHGIRPLEYIPLADIRAELDLIIACANNNLPFDESRLDHLLHCMESNKEYIAEQTRKRHDWVQEAYPFILESVETIKGYIPPDIFTMTESQLQSAGYSKALAKRIFAKKCLWLVRLSPDDLARMHYADLSGRYSTESQQLDIVEMAAIYGHMMNVKFEADFGGKKQLLVNRMQTSLSEMMALKAKGSLQKARTRNDAYKNETPLYVGRESLHRQHVVRSTDMALTEGSESGTVINTLHT